MTELSREEVLKEVGEPVAWCYDFSMDVWLTTDKKKAESIIAQGRQIESLYTETQLLAIYEACAMTSCGMSGASNARTQQY